MNDEHTVLLQISKRHWGTLDSRAMILSENSKILLKNLKELESGLAVSTYACPEMRQIIFTLVNFSTR